MSPSLSPVSRMHAARASVSYTTRILHLVDAIFNCTADLTAGSQSAGQASRTSYRSAGYSQVRGPLGINLKPEANGARGWFDGPEHNLKTQLET
jgi:hypothetical protein